MNSHLNVYRTSHDTAHAILKSNTDNLQFLAEAKKVLKTKAFLMPLYKIKGDKLSFKLLEKKYSIQHVQSSIFIINGQRVDIEKKGWEDQITADSSFNLLWHDANALIPGVVYSALIFAVALAGVSCIAIGLGSQRSSSISHQWLKPAKVFDKQINALAKDIRLACGAKASDLGNYLGFHQFFSSYCHALGQRGLALYEQKSKNARRSDGSVNQQVYSFMRQRPNELAPRKFSQEFINKYQYQTCFDDECSRKGKQVDFKDLDRPTQDFLTEVTSNSLFTNECAENGLNAVLNPVDLNNNVKKQPSSSNQ